MIEISVPGFDGVKMMLGAAQDALTDAARVEIYEGIIREKSAVGLDGTPYVNREYTLEGQARDAFASGGKTALRGAWTEYGSEPNYKRIKEAAGAGSKVGTWEGSKNPLSATFLLGHPQHSESVGAAGLTWRSGRYYAGTFHQGGPVTPFDKVPQPARPIVTLNDKFAHEVARAYVRAIAGRCKAAGRGLSDVRVDP